MNEVIELSFNAKIVPDGDGFLVTFRELENAFTEGATYEEAIFNAQEVLDMILLDRLENNDEIPLPSRPRKGEVPVSASPEVLAPALLHILRTMSHRTMSDVARSMGVPYQSYQRMESGKNLTMRSLKRAAAAMDSVVELRLRKATPKMKRSC